MATLDGESPLVDQLQQHSGYGPQGTLEPNMCMLHGKRRSAHVLQKVQTPWGIQSHCKADSRCKEGRGNNPPSMPFPMFGGMYGYQTCQPSAQQMQLIQTHALCQKHHKPRLMRYLEQQGSIVVCKEDSQCLLPKAIGEDGASENQDMPQQE